MSHQISEQQHTGFPLPQKETGWGGVAFLRRFKVINYTVTATSLHASSEPPAAFTITHFILATAHEAGPITILIYRRETELRERQRPTQGHTARKWKWPRGDLRSVWLQNRVFDSLFQGSAK